VQQEEEKKEPEDTKSKTVNGNPLNMRQLNEIDMIEVTEENIGNYTIEDVIMPIIGHKVKLPSHPEMRKIIEDIMK
jgi:hypothetical protein